MLKCFLEGQMLVSIKLFNTFPESLRTISQIAASFTLSTPFPGSAETLLQMYIFVKI